MSYDDWVTREDAWHDPGRLRDRDFPPGPDSVCDHPCCGEPVRVTIAQVGQFCGRIHAEWGMRMHELSMSRKRA